MAVQLDHPYSASFWIGLRIGFDTIHDPLDVMDIEYVIDQVLAIEKGWA